MVSNLGNPGEVAVSAEPRIPGGEEPLETHSLTLERGRTSNPYQLRDGGVTDRGALRCARRAGKSGQETGAEL